MDLDLLNKKVLITGASKGIGKAIKESLEKEGAICIDISRTTDFDLTKPEDLSDAMKLVTDVDILINNVGGGGTWKLNSYREIMHKNYGIAFEMTIAYLRKHKPSRKIFKPRKWGRVITISSIHGKEKGGTPQFAAAKSAQIALMKCLAGKCGNITFNTICPGHINTGKFRKKPKVCGTPNDVAGIVTFLCSDQAKHINGATIVVDGGESHSY